MKATELRRWRRDEYERMIENGLFAPGERVELIDGEILKLNPQGSFHATAVRLVEDALRLLFGVGFDVRAQLPVALGTHSEPEPDVAVVPGSPRDYREKHPSTAVLIVEVADATLEYDRVRKGSIYARAGITDYWLINLVERSVEVYRDPDQGSYRFSMRFLPGDSISPLAAPNARIAVADLLP
jgi:Uma2 family endonuclease